MVLSDKCSKIRKLKSYRRVQAMLFLKTESKISCYIVQIGKLARHSFTCSHRGLLAFFFPACMGVLYQWGEQSKLVGCLPVQTAGSSLMLGALFILCFILEGGVKKANNISGAKSELLSCTSGSAINQALQHLLSCRVRFKDQIHYYLLLSYCHSPNGTDNKTKSSE